MKQRLRISTFVPVDERGMSWNTVYVNVKKGFSEAILPELNRSWLRGTVEPDLNLVMFWLNEDSGLRELKRAIGSKMIFKYRLRFFTNLEEYIQSESVKNYSGFSVREVQLIAHMEEWESNRTKRIPLANFTAFELENKN